jgi:tetratricopeptide (TPR) repeat protein
MTANRIIQHIFQQPDIKQVDEAALDRLVTSYPYFTAARLLLARKQYSVQKNLLAPAVKKAQQYSTNMHYFYRFVTTEEKSIAPVEEAPVEVATPVQDEAVIAFPGQDETPAVEAQPVAQAAQPAEPAQETKIHVTIPKAPAEQPVTAGTNINAAATYNTEEELTVTANDVVATTTAPPREEPPAEPVQPIAQPAASIAASAQVAEQPVAQQSVTPPASVKPAEDETEPIKIFPLDTSETETSLTFQPLYTDDYFAYKRLKEPEQADQLSEKAAAEMKSFTSWLKDMKHTFAEKASKQWYQEQMHRSYEDADPEVSEAVEKMAMESITLNDDIVSETLAEIWARQHQYQTAIHIYQKLSLLNPNKSAYFAQKIKELQLLTEKS